MIRKALKYGLPAGSLLALVLVLFGIGPSLFTYALKDVSTQPPVPFLSEAPVIDGRLDSGLEDLPAREFDLRFRLFHSGPETRYRLAYGAEFLYLFVEAADARIVRRDRGYQNGDGFHLLLATPAAEGLTDRFYVLGFSPQDDPARAWARKVVWYHDVDTQLSRLPDDVAFEAVVSGGTAGYELLLPWRAVRPYHPWLSQPIGFNLGFVKAVGETGMVMDLVLFDWRFQAEQQRRRWVPLSFEAPPDGMDRAVVLPPTAGTEGKPLSVDVVSCGAERSETLHVSFAGTDEGTALETETIAVPIPAGTARQTVSVAAQLTPGRYRMISQVAAGPIETQLLVFPPFDPDEIDRRAKAQKAVISKGDQATFELVREEIAASIRRRKLDERLLEKMTRFQRLLVDPGALRQGGTVVRRGFVSPSDGTLQPYTLRLPEGYDPQHRYPLLVFLHGSGVTDERAALSHGYLDHDEYLLLFPYGRGMSHNYATDEAQRDIREAIDDVEANYSVDTSHIILGGFSMGGYGVYRTFWESPDLFTGLLVLSGEPQIPWWQRLLTEGVYPDIEERLEIFGDIPIFVFHGTQDRNNPYRHTAAFVERLQASGACCVELHIEDQGHGRPRDPKTLARLHAWLREVSSKPPRPPAAPL